VDIAVDAGLAQPPLGVQAKLLEDPLARLVASDEIEHTVAFGRGIFRMAGRLQAQPRPVPEQHVAAPAPGHRASEDLTRRLVGG
jgi:hypothetical protein